MKMSDKKTFNTETRAFIALIEDGKFEKALIYTLRDLTWEVQELNKIIANLEKKGSVK